MFSERLEVRVDEETMERLRVEAELRDVSVGELVRTAVQQYFEEDRRRRIEAAERLCSLEIEWPSEDWPEREDELYASMSKELA
jgi:Ribbon-helix-helix protein, copG family